MDKQLEVVTAEKYKASLLPEGKKNVAWTMSTFSKYVSLLYPHITVMKGQEWKKPENKYWFFCTKHGPYQARARDVTKPSRGCHCKGCAIDNRVKSAGNRRSPRATAADRQIATKLRAEGLSYREIGDKLKRPESTIQNWLNPETAKKSRQRSARWKAENLERHRANSRRYYNEFEHGRAKRNLYEEAQRLQDETGIEHHVDHIKPLSKGGEHLLINLQIIPAEENLSKGNDFRIEDQELLARRIFDLQ